MKYTYHEDPKWGELFEAEGGGELNPNDPEFAEVKAACQAQQVRDYCHTDYEIRKRTITTSLEPGKCYEI